MEEEAPVLTRKMRRAMEKKACCGHLADLRAAHASPPNDVAVKKVSVPRRIHRSPDQSYVSSPAQMCTEKNL